jgi:hypothetical protein
MRDLLIDIAPSRRVQVHHYFSLEGDDSQIIRAVRTALPVVCLPNYHGYKMSRPSTLDREFLSQSHAVARFQARGRQFRHPRDRIYRQPLSALRKQRAERHF